MLGRGERLRAFPEIGPLQGHGDLLLLVGGLSSSVSTLTQIVDSIPKVTPHRSDSNGKQQFFCWSWIPSFDLSFSRSRLGYINGTALSSEP